MPAHCPIRTPNPPASALVPLGALLFGFSLPTAATESAPTLAPVIVTDRQDVPDASNSYQGQTTTVGKLKQLPKDIPQALTIVTEKLMEDRGQSTLKDALSNVAGLTFNAGEGGRIGGDHDQAASRSTTAPPSFCAACADSRASMSARMFAQNSPKS